MTDRDRISYFVGFLWGALVGILVGGMLAAHAYERAIQEQRALYQKVLK